MGTSGRILHPFLCRQHSLSWQLLVSTPLDQATCVHNCLEQLDTHTRTACMEAGSVPPSSQERTILLSSVLMQARPLHLAFSLAYIQHFAFNVPSELEASLATLVHAVKMVELTQEKRCQS